MLFRAVAFVQGPDMCPARSDHCSSRLFPSRRGLSNRCSYCQPADCYRPPQYHLQSYGRFPKSYRSPSPLYPIGVPQSAMCLVWLFRRRIGACRERHCIGDCRGRNRLSCLRLWRKVPVPFLSFLLSVKNNMRLQETNTA